MSDFIPETYTNDHINRRKVIEIKSLFDMLDADKTGFISSHELLVAFKTFKLDKNHPELYDLLDQMYLVSIFE